MDVLGNIKQVAVRIPQPAQPVLPTPSSQAPALPVIGGGSTVEFDTQDAEAQRLANLRQAARNAPLPLGTQAFTLFKDSTGQVITRFRDTNSGRVTYIPEPNLLKLAGGGGGQALLNITA
ncbi:MAG: hypothetical protein SFX19_01910 [Alphaproteobacteria bacterium]|nr:hypothetical protein [Alphaproteobacteria bacterium]